MPGDGLAGFLLQLSCVEADIVIDAFSKPETGRRVGDLTRRVPGGTGGQFRLFQKHDIAPAFVGEVIGKAAPHDAAANNDDPRGRGQIALKCIAHRIISLICGIPVDTLIVQMYSRQP